MILETIEDIEKKPILTVSKGRISNTEENVKLMLIAPLLKILGWTDDNLDYEPSASSGKIDILLKIEGIPRMVVELKSLEKKLEDHVEQVFNYARIKDTKVFALSNGHRFDFFKVTQKWEDVDIAKLKPIEIIKKTELTQKEGLLRYYLGYEELRFLFANKPVSVEKNIIEFQEILNDLKIELYLDFIKKINEKRIRNPEFQQRLEDWIKKINWEEDWVWTNNFSSRIVNKVLKKSIEEIFEENKIYRIWKSCSDHDEFTLDCKKCQRAGKPVVNKDWVEEYKKPKYSSFKKEADLILRRNGFTLDTYDKFALEGAYTFINRVLFIRIFETNSGKSYLGEEFLLMLEKKITTDGLILLLQSAFADIASLFEKMYKAPLFNDTFLEEIELEKSIILKIIRTLIKFNFSSLTLDIVGELYQKNLQGDIRNSLGQFYTPREIIDFIIKKLDLTGFLKEIEDGNFPLVLDPACGSGGFLIVFYDLLKKKMEAEWEPTEIFKVITSSLYGLDIDNFAIQLSIMNLLIKEAITDLSGININIYQMNSIKYPLTGPISFIKDKTMPNGTSLISSEGKSKNGLSFADLRKKRFKVIFGNPPFFEIIKAQFKNFSALYPNLKDDSKPNIASLFLIRYSQLLDKNGTLSFVFPASILFSDAYTNVRRVIVKKFKILYIIQLGRAFSDVGLEQIVISLQRTKIEDNHKVGVYYNVKNLKENKFKESNSLQLKFINDKKYRLRIFSDDETETLLTKIENNSSLLGDLVLQYVVEKKSKSKVPSKVKYKPAVFRGMGWEKKMKSSKKVGQTLQTIKGTNIMRYGIKEMKYVSNSLKVNPSSKLKLILSKEKIGVQRLVTSRTRIVATKIKPNIVTISTIETIILREDVPYSIDFIIGILNSELLAYYVIDHIFMRSKLSTSLDREYAKLLPIPKVEKDKQEELTKIVANLEKIVNKGISDGLKVEEIEDLPHYRSEDDKLNKIVYGYYKLEENEIEIIRRRIREFYKEDVEGEEE